MDDWSNEVQNMLRFIREYGAQEAYQQVERIRKPAWRAHTRRVFETAFNLLKTDYRFAKMEWPISK